jgi:hypothetical protein
MAYSSSDLLTALTGGSTWRERESLLPESKDSASWLASSNQQNIMASLIDVTKDALLKKALTDQALMQGKLYG